MKQKRKKQKKIKNMKIEVQDNYDGFSIVVDGSEFYFDQEEIQKKQMVDVLKMVNPEAEITYQEIY